MERQAAEYTPSADSPGYAPSEDTVRLTNAINRGLEKPERSEEVVTLIMQGISARYCCPSSVQDIFSGGLYRKDALTGFFDEIRQRCQFKYWFFGHYHENMVIEKKYAMLYEQIIRLKL